MKFRVGIYRAPMGGEHYLVVPDDGRAIEEFIVGYKRMSNDVAANCSTMEWGERVTEALNRGEVPEPRNFAQEAIERMTHRLVMLAQRLKGETDPAMGDLAEDLKEIWNDRDPN